MVCRDGFLLSYPSRSTLPPTPSFLETASCLKVLPKSPRPTRGNSSAAPCTFWGGGIGPDGAAKFRSSNLGLRSAPDTRPGINTSRKRYPSSPSVGCGCQSLTLTERYGIKEIDASRVAIPSFDYSVTYGKKKEFRVQKGLHQEWKRLAILTVHACYFYQYSSRSTRPETSKAHT